MSDLFINTSKVLRDNLVLELKANNNFLRNYLAKNNNNPLFGYKVTIEQHHIAMMQNVIFPQTNGILLSINDYNATVLYKDSSNKNKIKLFHLNNISIIDPRIEDFF